VLQCDAVRQWSVWCIKPVSPGKDVAVSWACVCVCCGVLRCVAVCCSVLQHVKALRGVCGVLRQSARVKMLQCLGVCVCCGVLQCVAVCCSVLQCIAARQGSVWCMWCMTPVRPGKDVAVCVLRCVAVCCGVFHCVAVCWSVLQRLQ